MSAGGICNRPIARASLPIGCQASVVATGRSTSRGLKQLLPKAKFNDVTAQYALITRQALISGKMQPIEKEVVSVIDTYGQDLVGKMLEIVQETRRFLVITGGGVILLKKPLLEMLDAAAVEAERDYFLVNRDLASVLNSVGALFAVLFMATKK